MRRIVIHKSEPDEQVAYWVECPSLGIASMGDTIEEAISMIREAIELHIEDLIANGEAVPPEDSDAVPDAQTLVIEAR
jgi:predicted RNase H-like HicB family nuclease